MYILSINMRNKEVLAKALEAVEPLNLIFRTEYVPDLDPTKASPLSTVSTLPPAEEVKAEPKEIKKAPEKKRGRPAKKLIEIFEE